jgi:hypothetical protein
MHTSIEIHNRITALRAEQAAVPADAENREERLFSLQGQIAAYDVMLAEALAAEEAVRQSGGTPMASVGSSAPVARSLAEMAFGPRASFAGIQPGFRAAITIPAGPGVTDPTIPAFVDLPRGFADTLVQAPTEGAVTYLRRGARVNGAAQWSTGDKASSSYAWTEHTAPLAWIAHHAPITKTQASDWGQLDAIIRSEMMLGLAQRKSIEAISGTNSSGITGITNTAGILTYTAVSGDNVYDSVRRSVTRVLLSSGFYPTHVAMSPQVREELDLLKGTDGHYLVINVGDSVWRLPIVEDNGLTVVDGDTTHYGAIVYASVGATWYTKETDNIEIGLVDDQFINNAYTLLAEGRNALAVRFPDAFCYMADAIDPVTDASS